MKRRKPWTPLRRAAATDESQNRVKRSLGLADDDLDLGELYVNGTYQVMVRRQPPTAAPGPDLVHLSVRRRDRRPVHDWRDLQRIKNERLGPEHEAVELYPAESRRAHLANQYQLWALDDPSFSRPVGFDERRASGARPPAGGQQTPF